MQPVYRPPRRSTGRLVRIELAGKGTPDSGDLQGLALEYRMTIEYGYEQVASFSDADFALDIPADAFWGGVS